MSLRPVWKRDGCKVRVWLQHSPVPVKQLAHNGVSVEMRNVHQARTLLDKLAEARHARHLAHEGPHPYPEWTPQDLPELLKEALKLMGGVEVTEGDS